MINKRNRVFKDDFARKHIYRTMGSLSADELVDIAFLHEMGESDAQIAARYNLANCGAVYFARHDYQGYNLNTIGLYEYND